MGTKRSFLSVAAIAAALFVVGCGKKKDPAPEPMPSPPEFGSTEQTKTLAGFMEGKWCPTGSVDSELAKKYDLDPNSELDVSQHWIFNADGTFAYGKLGSKNQITGKWTAAGDQAYLMYEMWDDETIQQRKDRLAKDEEGGGQPAIMAMMAFENTMGMLSRLEYLRLTDDKKGLTFGLPEPADGSGTTGGMEFLMADTPDLVRMK
jgi:hypothetical protein